MTTDHAVAERARTRHGTVTHADLRECGLSQRQIDRRVGAGRLRRLHRGVFAIAGAPDTFEQRALAATLAAGTGSLVSHTTAACLWKLEAPELSRIEITVPRDRLPALNGVKVHRSVLLDEHDIAIVDGIPVTSISRTLVDLTAVRGVGWIARALDDSLRSNRTTLPKVRSCSERLGGAPGRRPSVVRLLVAERLAVGGGLTESRLERIVLGVLVDAGVPEPVPQFPVEIHGKRVRLDFAWPAERVALEVDGFGPHAPYSAFHDDRRRDLLLRRAHWNVLRVTSETPASEIVESVRDALAG